MTRRLMAVAVILMFSTAFSGSTPSTELHLTKDENLLAELDHFEIEKTELSFEEKVGMLYDTFKDKNESMPKVEAFQNAMKGYYKLEDEGRVKNKLLTIIDFDLSSKKKRFWVLDMENQDVLFNTYTSHGKNSGWEFAKSFSNAVNSHKSSLGFYVTGETYYGKNGLSLFIDGMEKGFNSNARKRYVVIHGSDYVNESFVTSRGRAGRSYGCPAVPRIISKKIINTIKGNSVVYINKSYEEYLESSSYLNSKKA
ncbi:murein L,D-transpeptidase catalytic domain family protein [Zunongwangia sp. HGR-M22]|uniref:murein L,D-transpeptidase catalytic domain family protein n=1 Tax=Zunongwangia sp. HGR-M22 TaxID=3015168 RepID=UPI0022DD6CDB|nr:murein L,D-transpeptidase catalytic domain family protein [Zunongwangia sp. HGR-M22]WBL26541.1 murein L,D-transpeptidase catalytic domain family protein [Zunongwangia sp. HGR-M22]